MKFCQIDKISTCTCIFGDTERLSVGQDFNVNYKQAHLNEISLGLNYCSCPHGVLT